MSKCYIGVRFLRSRNQISFAKTVISSEADHRLMPADLHDGERIDPSPTEIGNSRMMEVVESEVCDPCSRTCGFEAPLIDIIGLSPCKKTEGECNERTRWSSRKISLNPGDRSSSMSLTFPFFVSSPLSRIKPFFRSTLFHVRLMISPHLMPVA